VELEAAIAALSIFEQLRPDEIGRIARRFERKTLAAGERFASDRAQLVVVVSGAVELEVAQSGTQLRARMTVGDRFGTYALVTGYAHPFAVTADAPSAIALLDAAGFEHVLAEFPAVALPLSREVAAELAARDDVLRQLLELHAAELPAAELAAAIDQRRLAQQRIGARVTRSSTRGLFRRYVIDEGAEPAFWMLVGFVTSLAGARLVVHLILKYGLEKQLFALVPGNDPNPMHVHHFNYGLVLIGVSGLVALFPRARRVLRGLAFVFGLGAGLVFDEFALFWNLNPEYAQRLSLVAAAIAAAVLLQLAYFRRFWAALLRRAWLQLRGTR
jgi:CRP-like cAMP-binding protein